MRLKHRIKILLRSHSWKFTNDNRSGGDGAELSSYYWNGKPVFYRPGSSDTEFIYNILLKKGKRGEYWVPREIKPRIIFDIGANVGVTAIFFSYRFPSAQVHCFEPVSENCIILKQNIEHYPNITLHQVALGSVDGELEIYASDNATNYGGFSFYYNGTKEVPRIGVKARNAGRYCKEIGVSSVDLIKIDTEGAEFDIIKAMDPELIRKTSWIIGELHSRKDFMLLDYLSQWFDIDLKKTLRKPLYMFNACNKNRADIPF